MSGAFDGKLALVTGASRGLGYATALELARRGAHVIALARTVGGLEDLDDAAKGAPGGLTLTPLDICDDAGLERLGAAVHDRWGALDILVHAAAAAAPMSPAEHAAAKDFDGAMKVNARATQRLIRVVDPLLKAAKVRAQAVMVVDDDAAGTRFNAAYGASKAAGAAVARSWAAENARIGPLIWLAQPPAMPTAVRARAHPGEDPSTLTPCGAVAERLIAAVESGARTPGDLLRL